MSNENPFDSKEPIIAPEEASVHFESLEPMELLPEEQPEEYLNRIRVFLCEDKYRKGRNMTKGFNIFAEEKYAKYFERCLAFLTEAEDSRKKDVKFSTSKNLSTLEIVTQSIDFTNNSGKIIDGRMSFEHTNEERKFFGTASKIDNIPYSQSLFGISGSQEIIEGYAKRKLEGRKIAMLGGGNSIEDLLSSQSIHPDLIVNIDPYITSEKIDKGKSSPYISLPTKAEDSHAILTQLQERQIDGFDEVWASYSVPYYLASPKEIQGMFATIKAILLEGGTARITPLKLGNNGTNDGVNELINQVKTMLDSPEYNVYFMNHQAGGTLFIKKLNSHLT